MSISEASSLKSFTAPTCGIYLYYRVSQKNKTKSSVDHRRGELLDQQAPNWSPPDFTSLTDKRSEVTGETGPHKMKTQNRKNSKVTSD